MTTCGYRYGIGSKITIYFMIPFIPLCIIGIPLNALSFFYFFTSKSKSIPNRLMMSLSVVDVLSITFGLLLSAMEAGGVAEYSASYQISYVITTYCYNVSGFFTSTLAITRVIAIAMPLYQIRSKLLYWCLFGILILLAVQAYYDLNALNNHRSESNFNNDLWVQSNSSNDMWAQNNSVNDSSAQNDSIIVLISMIELVGYFLCTAISGTIIIRVVSSRMKVGNEVEGDATRRKTQRKVASTIAVISCTFAICNIVMIVLNLCILILSEACVLLAILSIVSSINSTANPIIYIYKNRDIQDFMKTCFKKIRCCKNS